MAWNTRTDIKRTTYINASWKISSPSVITNLPIRQKTPIGAYDIIIKTSCMNTVLSFSNDSLRFPVKWLVLLSAKPNNILKKTMASIWLLAIASMIFEGNISKIVEYTLCPSGNLSGAAISDEYPAPGLNIEATNRDKLTAIAVVPRYNPIVFSVILPRLWRLLNEDIPETKEKNTKGTINIFSRFIKIAPPRLNI